MPRFPRWVWFPFGAVARYIGRNAKRIAVTVAGFALLAIGLVMLVLPGPGVLVLLAGLAVLASEYVWAQRALNLARRAATAAKDRALGRRKPKPESGPDDQGPDDQGPAS